MSQEQLIRLVARGISEDEVRSACRALGLCGDARLSALLDHPAGARLLAALELGRRALFLPSGRGRRVRGPADVRELFLPHAHVSHDGCETFLAVLDVRMRAVRVEALATREPGAVLRRALAAGGARLALGWIRAGPAVPRPDDVDDAIAIARAAGLVGCALVDAVIVGDDGVASLSRLGLIDAGEVRYR